MAIVENWAAPLADSILKMLSKPEMTASEINRVCEILKLLDGAKISDSVSNKLEIQKENLEKRYQAALKKLETVQDISAIEQAIKELEQFSDYQDVSKPIEAAKQRIEQLKEEEKRRQEQKKKRRRICFLAAAAAVVALVVFISVSNYQKHQQMLSRIAEARTLAEEGKNAESIDVLSGLIKEDEKRAELQELQQAIDALLENTAAITEKGEYSNALEVISALYNGGVPGRYHSQMEALAGAVLEKTAADLGAQAACELYETYEKTARNILDSYGFRGYCTSRIENKELPLKDRWQLLCFMAKEQLPYSALTQETIDELSNACIELLIEETAAQTHQDMSVWAAESRELLDRVQIEPDTALRFLYALHGAGYDVGALFPNGVPVRISLGESIVQLKKTLTDDASTQLPQMSKILPLSIREKTTYDGGSICKITNNRSQDDLEKRIDEIQINDAQYEVRLLAEYLFLLPEDMLPASFSECDSLLCMQNTYYCSGSIYEKTTKTSKSLGTYSTYKYHPMFIALDVIAVYAPSDKNVSSVLYAKGNNPQAADDEWFNKNKNSSSLYTEANMMGEFDTETLKNEYEEMVKNIYVTILLMRLSTD